MRKNKSSFLVFVILLMSQASFILTQVFIYSVVAETDSLISDDFLGKWAAKDNPKHYVIATKDSIIWEHGDADGPDRVAVSQCQFFEGENKVAFKVKHGVRVVDSSGRVTRGSILVTMSRAGEMLIIKEEQSGETVRNPSGFYFQPVGGKEYIFYKAE